MDRVDALSRAQDVRSVVELSLQPGLRRGCSALFKGVAAYTWDDLTLAHFAALVLPQPAPRPFWLLGVDVTSQPRLEARTLGDRSFVHQPPVIAGQNRPPSGIRTPWWRCCRDGATRPERSGWCRWRVNVWRVRPTKSWSVQPRSPPC